MELDTLYKKVQEFRSNRLAFDFCKHNQPIIYYYIIVRQYLFLDLWTLSVKSQYETR